MTVYVDDMAAPYRRMKMCHMVADTEAELHAMAARIGIARRWYQGDHYDICQTKKALAIAAGAVAITQRQLGCMTIRRRATGALGSPDDAMEWVRSTVRLDARQSGKTAVAHLVNGHNVD